MLDQARLLQELQAASKTFFLEINEELDNACTLWSELIHNKAAQEQAQKSSQLGIPSWQEPLDIVHTVADYPLPYDLLAVDGSQIYPDKHTGTNCFLINIGTVMLSYGAQISSCNLQSIPFVFSEQEMDSQSARTLAVVNGKREELEFKVGLEQSLQHVQKINKNTPYLFLFDGPLIFWHLQEKDTDIKDYFLQRYLYYLHQFYEHKILFGGYISLSKGKDIIHLLQAFCNNFQVIVSEKTKRLSAVCDADLMFRFLQPGQRTILFKAQGLPDMPSWFYPHFFYYHAGQEIVRIEVPAYIASDKKSIATLASLVQNQVNKGHGYPIALAEAHEQAVVKGADRDLFYQLVQHLGIDRKRIIMPSQKSIKKRKMTV